MEGALGEDGREGAGIGGPDELSHVPRSMMSRATEAMKMAKAGWLMSGRNTKRSRMRPKAMQAASVMARLITSGTSHPGRLHARGEGPEQQRADDQHLALGQVHDARGAVDDDEGDRHEAIDETHQGAFDQDLNELDHAGSPMRLMATGAFSLLVVPSW